MLTEAQKELRLHGIGGSEIGALAGLNHFMKPIDVYAAKVEGRELEDNHHLERGRFLEEGTARWWAHRKGGAALRTLGTLVHPDHSIVVCTPDYLGTPPGGPEVDLSIKAPGPFAEDWGDEGTDDIPPAYIAQVQWELITLERLYGITESDVAAVINGNLRIYRVRADHPLQDGLITIGLRFWKDHIEAKRPPEPDGSKSYSADLKRRFRALDDTTVTATPEAEAWAARYFAAKAQEKAIKEEVALSGQHLRRFIGNATAMTGANFKISFREGNNPARTDWEAICAAAHVPPELIKAHTSRTKRRNFRPRLGEACVSEETSDE